MYDNSTLVNLAAVIIDHQGRNCATIHNERDVWLEDSKIADNLVSLPGPVIDWRHENEGHVFSTGSTGFVGAFLLAYLLRQHEVRQVACLVRAVDTETALKRLKHELNKYNLWEDQFVGKLLPLSGILEDQYLGLGSERSQEIANWASVVFHLRARVNYTQPYSLHRAATLLERQPFCASLAPAERRRFITSLAYPALDRQDL